MRRAVYPGSFDPITYGHLDVLARSLEVFDGVTIAVLENPSKETFFSLDERLELVREVTRTISNLEVTSFRGLLVDFMSSEGLNVIVRGIRFVSDFEYEMQMALMNSNLGDGVETLFLVARPENTSISSSLVKEVALLGREVTNFVPSPVSEALKRKIKGGMV